MTTPIPKVCIVGAGIAGLTLARVLVNNGIHPTILERDASPEAREQGGTLDLKRDSGQAALRIARLHEEFQKLMRKEGQDVKVMDPNGNVMMQHIAQDEADFNPEIDRTHLRGIFIDVLGDHIRWGSFVRSVQPNTEGKGYRVTLENGCTEIYDLVVGADGCFSRVRHLITDVRPAYTGVTFTETYLSDAATKHPRQYEMVGRGMLIVPAATANGVGLIAQQNSDGRLRIYAILRVPEDWPKTNGYPWDKDIAATRQMLLQNYTQEYTESLLNLIRLSDDYFRPWPIYALPVGHKWTHKQGITLVGDAAHVTSPFAGEGANISMLDGAELGQAIANAVGQGSDLDGAIEKFEEEMFERAAVSAGESHENMLQFTGEKPVDPVERMKEWERELKEREGTRN